MERAGTTTHTRRRRSAGIRSGFKRRPLNGDLTGPVTAPARDRETERGCAGNCRKTHPGHWRRLATWIGVKSARARQRHPDRLQRCGAPFSIRRILRRGSPFGQPKSRGSDAPWSTAAEGRGRRRLYSRPGAEGAPGPQRREVIRQTERASSHGRETLRSTLLSVCTTLRPSSGNSASLRPNSPERAELRANGWLRGTARAARRPPPLRVPSARHDRRP